MTTNKRSRKSCPLCSCPVEEFGIHLDSTIIMCSDTKCDYPFNGSLQGFIKTTRSLSSKRRRSRIAKPPGFIDDGYRQGGSLSNKEHLDKSSQKARLDSNVLVDSEDGSKDYLDPTTSSPDLATQKDVVSDIMNNIDDCLTPSRFSLADIEQLLGDKESLGEIDYGSSAVVTPKDGEGLDWMTGLNDVFNFGPTDSKYDPLTSNQEFDILLGL
ncbi:hypothetical protein CLU79DRAFT_726524 [Phycomyces nitens]|nr:hypothetical protein CLU79DRAFT_726524 [Phycomyces nitens]